MQWLKRPPVIVFIVGSLLTLIVLAATLLFLNTEQCPADYTQQQVDATGCVVGVNIGYGMGMFTSIAIGVFTILATVIMVVREALKRRKR